MQLVLVSGGPFPEWPRPGVPRGAPWGARLWPLNNSGLVHHQAEASHRGDLCRRPCVALGCSLNPCILTRYLLHRRTSGVPAHPCLCFAFIWPFIWPGETQEGQAKLCRHQSGQRLQLGMKTLTPLGRCHSPQQRIKVPFVVVDSAKNKDPAFCLILNGRVSHRVTLDVTLMRLGANSLGWDPWDPSRHHRLYPEVVPEGCTAFCHVNGLLQ